MVNSIILRSTYTARRFVGYTGSNQHRTEHPILSRTVSVLTIRFFIADYNRTHLTIFIGVSFGLHGPIFNRSDFAVTKEGSIVRIGHSDFFIMELAHTIHFL